MTQPTTELDGLLIESLTRLTAHLDEQNERIENLTKQLNELPALANTMPRRRSTSLADDPARHRGPGHSR